MASTDRWRPKARHFIGLALLVLAIVIGRMQTDEPTFIQFAFSKAPLAYIFKIFSFVGIISMTYGLIMKLSHGITYLFIGYGFCCWVFGWSFKEHITYLASKVVGG